VIVASIAEMLLPQSASTRPAAAQVSNQSPQTFRESLLAVSKASSGADSEGSNKSGRRQKSVLEDAKLPGPALHGPAVQPPSPSPQTVPQPVLVAPPTLLPVPAVIPTQLLPAGSVSAGASTIAENQPMLGNREAGLSGIESNTSLPTVLNSNSVPSDLVHSGSNPLPAGSTFPSTDIQSAKGPVVPAQQTEISPSNTVTNVTSNKAAIVVTNALPTAVPGETSSAVRKTVPSVIANGNQDSIPKTVPDPAANSARNSTSDAVLPGISNAPLNPNPLPVVHVAVNSTARGDVAAKSTPVTTGDANPTVAAPDPGGFATGVSVPGDTANQLMALIQPAGVLLVKGQAGASSLGPVTEAKPSVTAGINGKDGVNNTVNEAIGLKQNAPSASEQAGSQAGSQGTATSGDQSQSGPSQQGQNMAPAQSSFASHTISAIDHGQNPGIAPPLQAAPTPAGIPGHSAKTPEIAAPASIAVPQELPAINTAKLIQSMGQSAMRVGMRSDDFGNISISTSATRDLISAQISLDHGELARTLATHLPEMQARFGGNHAMDVRIDMNGQGAGQGAGTSAGMSNGSADESRAGRQQRSGTPSSHPVNGFAEQGHSLVAAGMPTGDSSLDARLDIRA
jgi:hypothetical protein